MMNERALKILFDEGDFVGYKRKTTDYLCNSTEGQFFVLNALKVRNGRAIADNLNKYRNILLEFDGMALDKQTQLIEQSGLPYSLKTFSGNKSYHYIISLKDPVSSEDYKELVAILYTIFPKADQLCKNPGRLSRTPDTRREDTGAIQDLVESRKRIKNEDFIHWLKVINAPSYLYYLSGIEAEKTRSSNFRKKVAELQAGPTIEGNDSTQSEELLKIVRPNWKEELNSSKVLPGDRHRKAVGLAMSMLQCGMDSSEVTEKVASFLENNGKSNAMFEAIGIVDWSQTKVIPLELDEITDFNEVL